MVLVLFTFFLIAIYQLPNGIMISNLIYYVILFNTIKKKKAISIYKEGKQIAFFLIFCLWVIISTLSFAHSTNSFTLRNLVQLIFTLQYYVFFIKLEFDNEVFEKWIITFSVIVASSIVLAYVLTGEITRIASLYGIGRMWGENLFPGWPNGLPIPLLFGLWMCFKKKASVTFKVMIALGAVITSSRAALLGVILIYLYFNFDKIRRVTKKNILLYPILLLSMIVVVITGDDMINLLFTIVPTLEQRLSVTYDRQDILSVVKEYVSYRPWLGFGGNSLDQVQLYLGNISNYGIEWPQAHSWFLDTLLRYGYPGVGLFTSFLISLLIKIKDKDKKFMFLLIVFLGLFQMYLRNFSILILLVYLSKSDNVKA